MNHHFGTLRWRRLLGLLSLIWVMTHPAIADTVQAGPYKIEISVKPDPPIVGDNEIRLRVTYNGQPAPDIELKLTHDMVGHSMNPPPPALTADDPGQFSGILELSMPGLWELEVHAEGPEGGGSGKLQLKKASVGPTAESITSDQGQYQVSLQTTPARPTVGDVPVQIEANDPEGTPVSEATVFVGADMPGMGMGLRPVMARQTEAGVYQAVVPLSMEGLWKLTVEVNQESHEFSLVVGRSEMFPTWLFGILGVLVLSAVVLSLARGWRPPVWQVVVLSILALAAWGLAHFAAQHRPADKSMGMEMDMAAEDMGMNISDMQSPTPVVIEPVKRGDVETTVTYTGTVEPYLRETLYPRVEGWLLELPVYPGDRVEKFQEVGRLDDREVSLRRARAVSASQVDAARAIEAQARVQDARAGLSVATAQLTAAQKQAERAASEIEKTAVDLEYWQQVFERERELLAAEAVSQEEFDERKAQYATARVAQNQARLDLERAEAEVEAQQGTLKRAHHQLDLAQAGVSVATNQVSASRLAAEEQKVITDYTVLRSGISGVVTERITDPGVLVRPGTPILSVAQIDRVRLQFTVAEEDLRYIRRGTEVKVTSQTLALPLSAQITSLFHDVDPRSRTGLVEALVSNPEDALLPGSYVVGEFTLHRETGVLWVPRSAVIRYYDQPAVWVETQRGGQAVAGRRSVEVGLEGRERVEILKGLSAGERVIVAGHRSLVEGAPVIPARPGEGVYRHLLLPQRTDSTTHGGHQH